MGGSGGRVTACVTGCVAGQGLGHLVLHVGHALPLQLQLQELVVGHLRGDSDVTAAPGVPPVSSPVLVLAVPWHSRGRVSNPTRLSQCPPRWDSDTRG